MKTLTMCLLWGRVVSNEYEAYRGGLVGLSATHTAHYLSTLVNHSNSLSESDGHSDVCWLCSCSSCTARGKRGVLCDLRRRCGENGTCVLGLKGGGVHVSVLAETAAGATPQGPTWIIKVVAGLAETIRDFRVSPDGGIVRNTTRGVRRFLPTETRSRHGGGTRGAIRVAETTCSKAIHETARILRIASL